MFLILNRIRAYITEGNKRSVLAKKNVLATFFTRIIGVPISFLLIPLTIDYVDSESYGIWITISSIVSWMSIFDIGINNGLRNRLAESIANDDFHLAKKYVSTTYTILGLIALIIFVFFVFVNCFLDWSRILNTSSNLTNELSKVSLVLFGYFSLRFVFSTISTVLLSYQLPAQASLRGLIEQASSLIVIFLLTKYTTGSLLNLALGLCIAPLIVLVYFNITLFSGKLRRVAPSLMYVDFTVSKDLMGIGIKFFVIQIAGIVQFQTANFIIIQNLGPEEVTSYNIVYKYFSILTMLMAILMTPIWSAVTDAYAKRDYVWIIKIERKFKKIAFLFVGIGVVMVIFAPYAYDFWLGKGKISISFSTSLWMLIFTSVSLLGSIYSSILNGISALDMQWKASILSPFIFILASIFFLKYLHFGIVSVIIASIVANFNAYLLAPWEFRRIFYAKGNI